MRAVAVLAVLLLAACAPTPVVKTVCPPLKEYDPAFLGEAAAELRRLGDGNPVAQLVIDYRQLRDVIRACGGK